MAIQSALPHPLMKSSSRLTKLTTRKPRTERTKARLSRDWSDPACTKTFYKPWTFPCGGQRRTISIDKLETGTGNTTGTTGTRLMLTSFPCMCSQVQTITSRKTLANRYVARRFNSKSQSDAETCGVYQFSTFQLNPVSFRSVRSHRQNHQGDLLDYLLLIDR
ncbi:hypothetical protein MJO28_007460 [Puccinia striiformis f. sp. tritici]|uniref:Uncharacterized protein n=1 Tax=Puccinia striiformis f. sp. tritici TaxID=168172 RepID=A0ACC0EEG4_9BASI|nr:hypothetical protein MJO28_007460 [Puccinia striiformis f. sp. tritici]